MAANGYRNIGWHQPVSGKSGKQGKWLFAIIIETNKNNPIDIKCLN